MSRILLVRMDGIGDALVLVPLIAALRAAGHELGALLTAANASAYAADALAFAHVVDRIPWPRHGLEPRSHGRALAEVRDARYDIALIASEEPAAYEFAKDAGIAKRVGFVNGWEKPIKSLWARRLLSDALVRPASARRETQHEVERLFALGRGLHAEGGPSSDSARLRAFVLNGDRRAHGSVVVQASPKLIDAGLDIDALAAVAERLSGANEVVLCEAPVHAAFAQQLHARTGLTLTQPDTDTWKHLIDGALAVVTPDSGAAHVAGMTGTPCVDLFADRPLAATDIARWRPWASPAETIVLTPDALAHLPDRVAEAVARLAPAPARS